MSQADDHVMGEDGQFHVVDEAVDLSVYGWEDWVSFALFWTLAGIVFYQVFTRYVLNDAAGWTEEIARYLLVAVTFLGGAMAVRRNTHIQVDFVYRFLPRQGGRLGVMLAEHEEARQLLERLRKAGEAFAGGAKSCSATSGSGAPAKPP